MTPEQQALSDVDEIAVERACRGDRTIPLTRAEMAAAFTWLDSHGYSAAQIAERLGVQQRTVERWRSGENQPKWAGHRRARVPVDWAAPTPCPHGCGVSIQLRNVPRHVRILHGSGASGMAS
jgi:hypothetical protein